MGQISLWTLSFASAASLTCRHCGSHVLLDTDMFICWDNGRSLVFESVSGEVRHRCGMRYFWWCSRCRLEPSLTHSGYRMAKPRCSVCNEELAQHASSNNDASE